jgi:hypothetical protein
MWQNWGQLAGATLTVSSEDTAWPKEWLKDPLRSKTWRTKTGWTIIAGYNDKIDITEGASSSATATIAAATYATGDALAAVITTSINGAATDSTWSCTYSDTTYKFTISHDGISCGTSGGEEGGLEWATGASVNTSIANCIGFAGTSDLSGTTSYTGEAVSYQSRCWAKFDMGADRDVDVIFLHHDNITVTSGIVRIQAHTCDAWTSPTISTSMSGTELWNTYLTSTLTYRWWRFEIDNTREPSGFTYAGVPYIGEYLQPSPGFSSRYAEDYTQLSEIGFAYDGAPFQNERGQAREFTMTWTGLTDNEKNKLVKAGEFMRIGRPFFFSKDSSGDSDDAIYSMLNKGISVQKVAPLYWQVTMKCEEAIG